ncbi:MAG: 4-alpha-glucanotransferase [Hungatella sp.]|nr:4-alpha-glucanotransferase [Hungatella sp.]
MRECGILLPIASLPSEYGIGAFSKEAYDFIDKLKEAGQNYWQILPVGPTGYGDSPYQSFSAFAGNPYFIDLEQLIKEGLLTKAECRKADFGKDAGTIDYEAIYNNRFLVLRKAYERWKKKVDKPDKELAKLLEADLCEETKEYCFYAAVKKSFGEKNWAEWDEDIKLRRPKAVKRYQEELADEILFFEFQQMEFKKQWSKLKSYAHKQGIRIIGDIPIYVAFDSADSWCHPELFQFDEESRPVSVAGCPPDGFSATGQLWGNPLYRWDYHEKTGFAWWMQRMEYCFDLYDVVRVDHFRGFDEYYSIPAGEETAMHGAWKKGPGLSIFKKMKETFGTVDIIAEDLGFLTPTVRKLLEDTGFPGMKVLQFAFDSRETSNYLPYFYPHNCVVYTGTHDNDTIRGWYKALDPEDRKLSVDYMNNPGATEEEISWDFIRLALASVADLAVIPIQDYLSLDGEARINLPSTLGGNWTWRLKKGQFTPEIIKRCREMNQLYGRGI